MANGISIAQSTRSRRTPKVLKSMTIEPRLGGGHTITHHYTDYRHDSEPHEFDKDEGSKALKHIAKHAGMPMIDEHEGSEADSLESEEK